MSIRFVDQLSTEEKVALLSGSDVWRTAPIERLGVPAIKVSDGPNGARGDSTTGARAVCLPASIALGASFDPELVAELGRLLGRETVRKGAHVLLAPTINLARHPLGGRNFESFGEDPILTSFMATAYITGVQDEGVGACAKHFVANDVEDSRLTVSSEVDGQTLREVYLAPFEAAVAADVWSVMAAYPKLNGSHCTENRWLLTELLREEWGFDGLVMSDWGATHHPSRSVVAGLDLEMPGPALALGPRLLAAVESGEVPMEVLDARASNVLGLSVRADRIGKTEEPEQSVDLPEERELVRRAAAEGMVLLSNRPAGEPDPEVDGAEADGPLLPLDRAAITTLAVIGPNGEPGVIQGGGSAQLPAHYLVSPVEGLAAALPGARVEYHLGCTADRYVPQVEPTRWDSTGGDPLLLEVFANPDLAGEPVVSKGAGRLFALMQGQNPSLPETERWSQRWTGRLPITESGRHEFGVLAIGRARVLVNGEMVADNWTDPQPGQAFFEKASAEVVGSIELSAGQIADVVVEWSTGDDDQMAGLRFGYRPPVDHDGLMDAAVAAAAEADVAVLTVGLTAEWETESHDRLMFGLPGRQDELIRRVVAANPRSVVVLNAGGPVDLPWFDEVPATMVAWYPGQEFGAALAEVLVGLRDPGGRLPVTFPRRLEETPTTGLVPGDGQTLHYGEGLLVGNRWYHRNGVEPLAPFGHGLSYGRFTIGPPRIGSDPADSAPASDPAIDPADSAPASDPAIDPADSDPASDFGGLVGGVLGGPVVRVPTVSVPVTNDGSRPGKCVVQAYLVPENPERPRVLAGFAAVALEPGQRTELPVALHRQAFRWWDVDGDRWHGLVGDHRLEIGTSSAEIAHTIALSVDSP